MANGSPEALPTHNLDAERALLGSLLVDPHCCSDVAPILRPDDFFADYHRTLYARIVALHDKGEPVIDAAELVESLRTDGTLESIGGISYLAELVTSVPVAAHATYYAKIVRQYATRRSSTVPHQASTRSP